MARDFLTGEEKTPRTNPKQNKQMKYYPQPTRMTYQQKLKEAQAKRALKQLNKDARREQVEAIKKFGKGTMSGSKKIARGTMRMEQNVKSRVKRAQTGKGLLSKIRQFKNNSIYDKE